VNTVDVLTTIHRILGVLWLAIRDQSDRSRNAIPPAGDASPRSRNGASGASFVDAAALGVA
jgi:hypothetical protein